MLLPIGLALIASLGVPTMQIAQSEVKTSPWAATNGYGISNQYNSSPVRSDNLFQLKDFSTSFNGVDVVVSNGIVTLNGTCTEDSALYSNFLIEFSDVSEYFITDFTNNDSNTFVFLNRSPDYPNNRAFHSSVGSFQFYIHLKGGVTYDNFRLKPMLVRGSTAPTEFSPYGIKGQQTGFTRAESGERWVTRTYWDINSAGGISLLGSRFHDYKVDRANFTPSSVDWSKLNGASENAFVIDYTLDFDLNNRNGDGLSFIAAGVVTYRNLSYDFLNPSSLPANVKTAIDNEYILQFDWSGLALINGIISSPYRFEQSYQAVRLFSSNNRFSGYGGVIGTALSYETVFGLEDNPLHFDSVFFASSYVGLSISAKDPEDNYQQGYDMGKIDGYTEGSNATIQVDYRGMSWQDIFNYGYKQGQNSFNNDLGVFGGLFTAIADVPIRILNGLFSFTLWGTPAISILMTLLALGLLLWAVGLFL